MNTSLDQQLRLMVPPKNVQQARELAALGDVAVTYLIPKQDWSAGTTALCVRTLALIGSKLALQVLEEYAADQRKAVVEELEQAWGSFDREEYARRVLAITYRERTHLELKAPTLDGVQHFSHLRSLRVTGRCSEIEPLADLTQLEELDLSEGWSLCDLTPLQNLTNLRSLKLSLGRDPETPVPYDLEPLGHLTQLTTLQLRGFLSACDFSFLANLKQLTELDINGPGDAILASISSLVELRKLSLTSSSGAPSLVPLRNLTSLASLTLIGSHWVHQQEAQAIDCSPLACCIDLVEIVLDHQLMPTDLAFLQSLHKLERLSLGNCMQLQNFSLLACLPSLTSLSLNRLQKEISRNGFGGETFQLTGLPRLVSLSLTYIQVETLLLADLPALRELHLPKGIQGTSLFVHSLIIERVPALSAVTLSSWPMYEITCTHMTALTNLQIDDSRHLQTVTLNNVPQLARVSIHGSRELQAIRVTGETVLTDLLLDRLTGLPQFEGLSSLQTLNIRDSQPLHDLSPLLHLPQLRKLSLQRCQEIHDLTPLATLSLLASLDLIQCGIRAKSLAHLPALTTLELSYLALQESFTLEDLPQLHVLNINNAQQHQFKILLTNVPSLERLRVEAFDISNHQGTSGLFWDALPALSELYIDGFGGLINNVESLRTLPSLTKLNFFRCHRFTDLDPLAELHALKSIVFFACSSISDLAPLARLRQLDSLEILSCEAIQDLTPLASLCQLTTLKLSGLDHLQSLSPIAHLQHLISLTLGSLPLHNFSALKQLTALRELHLAHCTIEDLSILQSLSALRKLTLYACQEVRDLMPLLALPHLEEIDVLRMRQAKMPPELKKRVKEHRTLSSSALQVQGETVPA